MGDGKKCVTKGCPIRHTGGTQDEFRHCQGCFRWIIWRENRWAKPRPCDFSKVSVDLLNRMSHQQVLSDYDQLMLQIDELRQEA